MSALHPVTARTVIPKKHFIGDDVSGIKAQVPKLARKIVPPLLITAFLWLTSANEISAIQGACGFVLACAPWIGYLKWRRGVRGEVPFFPMLAFVYWLYFAFPLFWGGREAVSVWSIGQDVSDAAITGAMLMAVLGLTGLWLGMRTNLGRKLVPGILPDIPNNNTRWGYLRFILVVGSLVAFFNPSGTIFGEEWFQLFYIAQAIIPTVTFAIIFRSYLRGEATRFDKILIIFFLGIQFVISMSSGWLGVLAYLVITCASIFIVEKRRIPRLPVVVLILYVLFFQVGKFSVRQKYWYDQEQGGKIERIAYWMTESFNKWGEVVSDPRSDGLRALAYQSLSRVSLLNQTANVLEQTPATVPYQYGKLYSYMVVAFIPRFVWPEKPSANEANRFYQVSYGITAEQDLERSSYAVGILTEGYINFGWFGVVGVMFILGILLDFFHKGFLSSTSGRLLNGIGFALLPYFLSIEAQMASYLGGTVQRILFILLILFPLIRLRRHQGPKIEAN